MSKLVVNVILFDGFETLDAFGPVEILGKMKDEFDLNFISQSAGEVKSAQGVKVITKAFSSYKAGNVLLIPGGMGTRVLIEHVAFINSLKDFANSSKFVLTVCTGSALLAKTGLLNFKKATSNKRAFDWVKSIATNVKWQKNARWSVDGKYYSSSGISAGMDMTLGFIEDIFTRERADKIAKRIEYIWNDNADFDPFSV